MFWGPSNTAGKIEVAFLIIVGISVALLAIVTFFMILFLVKYHKKKHPNPHEVKENVLLEVVWTVIPVALVLVMFYFGWVDFEYVRNPPKDAMPVNVIARQWSWLFEYENGKRSDVLKVPFRRPVKLILTSQDVIHSLYIPAFRIKEDCVPGMKTHLWFSGNELGSYDIFCTEYCGVGHSHMLSKVVVMQDKEFLVWYRGEEAEVRAQGLRLLQEKGCLGCHSVDGSTKVGPTFKGLFGTKVVVLTNGKEREVIADEQYIERSVLQPEADIAKGYPPIMPPIPVTKEELKAMIEYLKALS